MGKGRGRMKGEGDNGVRKRVGCADKVVRRSKGLE